MADSSPPVSVDERAALAARSVWARFQRRSWGVPGTRRAEVGWPLVGRRRMFGAWHYWWQAHLLDALVDAGIHRSAERADAARDAARLIRGVRLRNAGRWTNDFYDDMAWMGLAIERADRHLGLRHRGAVRVLARQVHDVWRPERGGGIPWRTRSDFFNAPANGPAAILLARTGDVERAVAMCDWIDRTLIDPDSHLVIDGVTPLGDGTFGRSPEIYTYCQGVVLGAELEALRLTGDGLHLDRIDRLLGAIETRLCVDGVILGCGGGDGGLFMGILARYLALVATDLPPDGDSAGGDSADERRRRGVRDRAAAIVRTSADAAWATRAEVGWATPGGAGRSGGTVPVFSADWTRAAQTDWTRAASRDPASPERDLPERDLSVQLSGWMVLEAAVAVDRGIPEHRS